MVKIGRQKTRPNTLVSPAPVGWRTLAEKVYWCTGINCVFCLCVFIKMDYSEREMMGERTPVGSPHPSRSVPSIPGQGSSSQHPNGVMQSGGLIVRVYYAFSGI